MLPLAYSRLWLSVGVLLIAGVLSGSLAPMDYVGDAMVWNDKVTHGLAYTALSIWFMGLFPKPRYLWVALAMVGLGALIELLQGSMSFGREADFMDLVANSSGILLGWLLAALGLGGWAQWIEARLRRDTGP